MAEQERWGEAEGAQEYERYLSLRAKTGCSHLRTTMDEKTFAGQVKDWTAEQQIFQDRCCGIADAIDKAHEAVGGRTMTPQEIVDGAASFAQDKETAQAAKQLIFKYAHDEAIVRQLPELPEDRLEEQRLRDAKKLREYQLRGWHDEPERHAKAARKGRLKKYGYC